MDADPARLADALAGVRGEIARIPLENISTLARERMTDPAVIPLWFGEGDVATPAFICEAATRALVAGKTFYAHQNGVIELREALARYHAGLGERNVGPDRITVTTSGMHALFMAVLALAGPGDNIVIVDPVWPNMGGAARLAGAEVRSVPMTVGAEGWTLDPGRVEAAMDGRTRIVFFASPGNPTGAVIPIETQRAVLDMCRARGVWLIADEVYRRMAFGEPAAPSLLAWADPEDRLLVVNSFSKSWAMTGWRIGWMVHPPSLAPTLAMVTQYSNSGVASFIQHAAVAALDEGEDFVAWMRGYCETGMTLVCDALEAAPRVRLGPRPKAGMYAFFTVEGVDDARAACADILARTDVGLAPGAFFGPGFERYFRICVCRAPESLGEAMRRLTPVFS